jgi:predicted CoA-substrate-specific enzyme activase
VIHPSKDEEKSGGSGGEPYEGPVYCGVDVGASATKVVLVDDQGNALARHAVKSGVDYRVSARTCLEASLTAASCAEDRVTGCVSTGYGRSNVDFAEEQVTEITCHGRGCFDTFPSSLTVVDIGGQDSKVILLDKDGRRASFKMNRKCAAGTGAFLEEIATRLDIPLDQLDALARASDKKFTLGSFCTVFAKTEILAYIRKGEKVENIIRGAFQSVVNRIIEMERFEGDVALTGGVVQYNPFLKEAMAETLGREVLVPPHPQFTGALGAALIARDSFLDKER